VLRQASCDVGCATGVILPLGATQDVEIAFHRIIFCVIVASTGSATVYCSSDTERVEVSDVEFVEMSVALFSVTEPVEVPSVDVASTGSATKRLFSGR
jgi:hypothetical protein